MKRKFLIGFLTVMLIIFIVVLMFEPSQFVLKAYELPYDIIKIKAAYSDDCLIALCKNRILIYDSEKKTEINLPDNTYIDFCAASRNSIMLVNLENDAVHYHNGEFISTNRHDILSVAYTNNSYIFLTDCGEIYDENDRICLININNNAYRLLGTPEPAYSLKNIIYYLGSDLYSYNIETENIYLFENCCSFEVNMCGVAVAYPKGGIKHFTEGNDTEIIQCHNSQDIIQIASRIYGNGYLLLYKNGDIKALKFDKNGKLCEDNKITNYPSSLHYYNPLRNDLSTCWDYIRKINKIGTIDSLYTSANGNIKINQQIIYIKSGNKLYVYY